MREAKYRGLSGSLSGLDSAQLGVWPLEIPGLRHCILLCRLPHGVRDIPPPSLYKDGKRKSTENLIFYFSCVEWK